MVSDYLREHVEGLSSTAVQKLVPDARDEATRLTGVTQFALVTATEVDEGWLIQTREYLTQPRERRSGVAINFYLVVNQGGQPAIDLPGRRWSGSKADPYRRILTEVFPDPQNPDRQMVMLKDGQTKVGEVRPDLPKAFRPFGAGPEVQFGVGDNGWGALALSPMTQYVAFVTRGTHAFLGVVDGDGKVKGLDLWFEGAAGELAWSHDSKYLAATVGRPNGVYYLQIWNVESGEQVKVTGLPEHQDVTRLQWIGNTLHLRAGTGRYMVDIASGIAKPAP